MKKKDDGVIYKEIPTNEPEIIVDEEVQDQSNDTQPSEPQGEQKPQKWTPNRILQCFAYFSAALIAVAMIFRLIFNNSPKVADYFEGISECLGYIVCIWVGFYFTRKRKSRWWLVGWLVSIVVIVVFYIFTLRG